MKDKYAVVEIDMIEGREYQDVVCYSYIFIPLWKFITNHIHIDLNIVNFMMTKLFLNFSPVKP